MAGLADSYLVEIEFPTSTLFGNAFTLDDSTYGVLDSVGRLGGRAWADVTAYVQEVTINRGRSRQLDSFDAGQASITLSNNTRIFDPTNTSGTYYGGIVPRQPVRISANGIYLFVGFIDDWNIDYAVPTNSRVTVSCVDAFSIMATIDLDEYDNTAGERTDQRISTVLALPEVATTTFSTSLAVGDSLLTDDRIAEGTTLLDYLQQVNKSEQGYLYIDRTGTLKFINRNTTASFASSAGTEPLFTDQTPSASSEYKYTEVGVQYGTELLYNRITVQNVDSAVIQTADDLTSQADYQVRDLSLNDLLLFTDADALGLANFLLGKYSRPVFRYDSVRVSLQNLSTADQDTLLQLDMADLVKVERNFTTGTPTKVERYGLIEGVEHTITLTEHTILYSLSDASTSSLRLDNVVFGILDSNTLGL